MRSMLVIGCVLLLAVAAVSAATEQEVEFTQAELVNDLSASLVETQADIVDMPSVAFLSSGMWTHNSIAEATASTDAALLEATHLPDDGRHGLATNGALTAHFATLRLDNTWAASHRYCASVGGTICSYKQICPQGAGQPSIGFAEIPFNRRSWAPVSDKENEWVNMVPGPYGGDKDRCVTASNPSWGSTKKTLKEINKDWQNHSKSLVACCDAGGVMKSFYRAGAKFPGSGSRKDDKAGRAANTAEKETRTLDDMEKSGHEDDNSIQTLINRGQVTTSTSYASNHNERFLALNSAHIPGNSGAWCALTNDQNQWIELDLGRQRRIISVSTQGRSDHPQWVSGYRMVYRNKKTGSWKKVRQAEFVGNSDQNTVVTHKLRKDHIRARYLRLIPLRWNGHISMRMDVKFTSKHTDGKKEKKADAREAKLDEIEQQAVQEVAMNKLLQRGQVQVSTTYASNHNQRFMALNSAHIPGNSGAWCAKVNDQNQWIQVDLHRKRRILGVSTQGRSDHPQWMTSYRVSYREDAKSAWKMIPRDFTANQDQNTVVRQSLRGLKINARYVRLQPLAFHGHLCLRMDVQSTSALTDGAAEKADDAREAKLDEHEAVAREEVGMVKLLERGQVQVSTSYASNHNERFMALNSAHIPGNSGAWCAKGLDQNQWVQVDLRRPRRLLGVATQGRSDYAQWVTEYRVQYRNAHGGSWKAIPKVFSGNQDQNTVVRHSLRGYEITARFLRLQPLAWNGHLCLRMDVDFTSEHTDGAAEKKMDAAEANMDEIESAASQQVSMVKLIERGQVSVSTSYASNHNERYCALNAAHIPGNSGAWCAKANDQNQWIQADLGRTKFLLGIVTQGRSDHPQWVTEYRLQYKKSANDAWKTISRTFSGNQDSNTVVRHSLRGDEINAQFVRLIPLGWNGHISMRWDVQSTSAHTDGGAQHAADASESKIDQLEAAAKNTVAFNQLIARGAIRVSTSYASNHNERFLALNAAHIPGNSNAWCALTNDQNQWVEANLGRPRLLFGVLTQGRGDHPQWVTEYRLSYKLKKDDAWTTIPRDFTGNQDSNTVVRHSLRGDKITAQYVRLQPLAWHGHLSMRMDLQYTSGHTDGAAEKAMDAEESKLDSIEQRARQSGKIVKLLGRNAVKTSSDYDVNHGYPYCALNSAVVPGKSNAWCAKGLDQNQWIEANLGSVQRIFGISTQGRGDAAQWVTAYRVQTKKSADGAWKDVQNSRVFTGNQDSNTVVRHSLRGSNIHAQYVRIIPTAWSGHLSMRWDIDAAADK